MKRSRYILIFIFLAMIAILSYRYLPFKIGAIGAYAKVGAHRVNSLDKLRYAETFFNKLELDLVFDETTKTLDVNHPPSKSIQLTFEEYIQVLSDKSTWLWLDIKNLNIENSIEILNRIELLVTKYGLNKNNLLIESRNPEALVSFTKNNFQCSYYLPLYLKPKSNKELNSMLKTIRHELTKQPTIAISTNYENYALIQKHFPQRDKYLWAVSRFPLYKFSLLNAIKNDPTVQVILFHYSSPVGNR